MSMAGHHISVLEGETSVPQPNSRLPRHNGLVFLDREEYFDVVNHCKNNPNINVIDSKYNFLIPKKIPPEEAHLHGQNVRCHRTTIKDPFDNWIEFKYYSYIEEIHSQRLDQIRRRNATD
jgi:extradiol dioxygenase family protein